jgi:hypothetical protein
MILRLLFIFLLSACSSAPKHTDLNLSSLESHPECKIHAKDLELPLYRQSTNLLARGMGTTGSLAITSLGLVSDVAVVTVGAVGIAALCDPSLSSACGDVIEGYMGAMEKSDLLWSTKRAYVYSQKWRCPYVDHISEALRQSASCNYQRQHFIATNGILATLESNQVLNECSSEFEKNQVNELTKKLKGVL